MKSSRISAGTIILSRLELTFSVIRTTLPRAFCLRSRKNVLRSAMIFSVQIISSSTAVIYLWLNVEFRIKLPRWLVNVLFATGSFHHAGASVQGMSAPYAAVHGLHETEARRKRLAQREAPDFPPQNGANILYICLIKLSIYYEIVMTILQKSEHIFALTL